MLPAGWPAPGYKPAAPTWNYSPFPERREGGFAYGALSGFRAGNSLCEPPPPFRRSSVVFRVPGDGPAGVCFVAAERGVTICEPASVGQPRGVQIAVSRPDRTVRILQRQRSGRGCAKWVVGVSPRGGMIFRRNQNGCDTPPMPDGRLASICRNRSSTMRCWGLGGRGGRI
jgi:hypothetical protein